MSFRLFDTMSRSLTEVAPIEPGHIRVYTCGPTVYARAHIGNFRTFVFEDVLRRWLERRFDKVTHVMNLTDVDDKIIRNATAHGHTLDQETEPWVEGFFEDLDALGIRRAHHYPRATEYIEEMVAIIERLGERGLTYESDGSVYFRIEKFPPYGRLSGMKLADLVTGASGRVQADEYDKEHASDFALWKLVGDDEIGWDTRLGRGRPGWHIECSAMSMSLLGDHFDIHCGGVDNIFPHHENEIAQSEGSTGQTFSNIWCHGEHLRIGGEKMAKSLGNFATLHELLASGAKPSAVRMLLAAGAHYRKSLSYSSDALAAQTEAVERLATFRDRLTTHVAADNDAGEALVALEKTRSDFENAMDEDLNLAQGLGAVFTGIREMHRLLDANNVSEHTLAAWRGFIETDVDGVVGIFALVDAEHGADSADDGAVTVLIAQRESARNARDWAAADQLRDQLRDLGIQVEDTAAGQRWHRI